MKLYQLPKNLLIKFSFLILTLSLIPTISYGNDKLIIIGNKNISDVTINSYFPKNIETFSSEIINDFQKKLFLTGFFEKIDIVIENNKLILKVKENPLVNFFYIEGIEQPNLKEKIFNISKIKENSIFQGYLVKDDLKEISNYLKNIGYLKNEIGYELIKIENNKINLFYKIKLNNKFKIKRVFFIGNKYFKSSRLSDVIFSSEHGWWKFLSNSTTPTESIINYDISKLKNFYLDNGFYDVQIPSFSIKILNNNYADIIYSINSGNKYLIKNIELFDNSRSIKDDNFLFLKKRLNKLINKNFNNSEIKQTSDLLLNYLENNNYNLNIKTNLKKIKDNYLEISFYLFEHEDKKIVDKISIKGNNITDDFVIRNSLNISEGDFFNNSKLQASINRIKGSGLFKNVTSELLPKDNQKVEIQIDVEEQPTGDISAGAGAGTSGATISAGINERNFLGKGIILNSNLNIGTQKIYGNIGYSNLDFMETGNSFNASVYVQSNEFDNATYQNKLIGSSASTNYQIFEKIYFNPGVLIDYDSVTANSGASNAIKRREGDYFTSKIFYNISKKNLNKDFNPTDGYTIGIGQGISLLSDIPYINNKIFGTYYKEYMNNFVGSVKSKIESINAFNDDIKFSDRLFVGGNNLRGFSDRGIGPKIDNDFIGGNYSFYTSISTTIPNGLPEKWNAITNVFFDTANVWGIDDNSTNDSNKIRSSTGVGLSWVSPLGPLSFTYAVPITKSSTDDVENFNFKIGTAF